MAESAVSFLLNQLSAWLQEERQLLGGLEWEVEYIRGEMGHMREFLRFADAKEESNSSLKEWVRQVREISYDLEDVLDKYILRFTHRGTNGFSGRIKKAYASIKNLKARRRIASEIQAIKYKLDDASKSYKRYRDMYAVMDQGSSSTLPKNEWYDRRGDALFLEEEDVVGIEKPRKQLLEWIWSMDNGLEVISVVGMGGLGKTTLVKKVYDDESIKRHFNCHVWVTVSDSTDVKHLLGNLIKKLVSEIKESPPQEMEGMSVDEMRDFIYEFLQPKNYIIVLDDVWDITTWEAIRYALPKRGAHGCIIMTTRFNSIGNAACSETDHVYNLEPLPAEESKELFYKKAFPRNSCPPYIKEFAESILKRCEGLPLAIVVIGGLLATKNNRAEEWELFNRSLSHELEDGNLQRLSKLLSLSYYDLPYYLKHCFLYLSIFPEGGFLDKEKIIRLWIAEGFVHAKQDKTMEEVAEGYLNELLSRSLIQVAEKYIDGRSRTFRIHDLLREYISLKSREQNIATIYGRGEMQWPNKIRRLAIHKSINLSQETNNFEYVRSLLLLGYGILESKPINELVSSSRLLKVLDLGGAPLETIPNEVFKLYHLKYLSLRSTMVKFIPKSIKNLQNLETLDLKYSNVTELPIEILKLHRLRHLLAYKFKNMLDISTSDNLISVKAPCDIGNCLSSLQKLCCIDADEVDGIKIVREIGKLTQLRRLGIANLRRADGMDLCSSIAKLTNLRSLNIWSVEDNEMLDLDYSLSSVTLPFLRTLMLNGCLEKVPQWVPSLNGLTKLILSYSRLREDPLNCLQDLPNLSFLVMYHAYEGEGLNFKAQGFQKLKQLWLGELRGLKWLIVEKGSMPLLEDLTVFNCKLVAEVPEGIEHLTNLQDIYFANMAKEFVDRVADQERNEGDNWRLACVPNVRFFNVTGGVWDELQR
ncbi:hypothetical protein Pfo_022371 [Paulownia fortunei]|nr:hypothetical protein Pfo_022371 [Paulownia fortunei]